MMSIKKRITYSVILLIMFILTIILILSNVSNNASLNKQIIIFVIFIITIIAVLIINDKSNKILIAISDWLAFVGTTLMILFIITSFFIYGSRVSGDSMLPTVKSNQYVFISTFNYTPKLGDIVTYQAVDQHIIKRVVALEGDVISFTSVENNQEVLTINGQIYKNLEGNKYYFHNRNVNDGDLLYLQILASNNHELRLSKEDIILLGDNADVSYDSRNYGVLSTKNVLGKVLGVKNGKK